MNIPNTLTLFRIILAPAFILFIASGSPYKAALVMALAGLTDFLDGYLARRLSCETTLGAALDGFADKLFLSSAFLALTVFGFLPWWLAALVVTRDVTLLLTIAILKLAGRPANTSPALLGKLSTFTQVTTVFVSLFLGTQYFPLLFAVAFLIIASSIQYLMREISWSVDSPLDAIPHALKSLIK